METWIILAIIGAGALLLVMLYNRLIALRQTRNQAFADIDVQLKQRFNLVPQLVETVKGYASHEKEVLESVTQARTQVQQAGNATTERAGAESALSGALMRLLAVAENYPDLKASDNFQKLMSELSDIEDKIAAARRFFNNATSELNTAIEQFPAVLIAKQFGFTKEEFFELDEATRSDIEKVPDVKF